MNDKYLRLTDWPFKDYVIRIHYTKEYPHGTAYRYHIGPDKWKVTGLSLMYADPDSTHNGNYEQITSDEASKLINKRRALLDRLLPVARDIATKAHAGQVDKGGEPYINHPLHVAADVEDTDEKIVALLHDVVEDTDVTLDDLKNAGFPDDIVNSVRVITHTPNRDYMDYIRYVKPDPLAYDVKMADLRHNMDESRLKHPLTINDRKRLAKYHRAYAELIY